MSESLSIRSKLEVVLVVEREELTGIILIIISCEHMFVWTMF